MNLKQIRTALIIVGPLLGLVVFALAQHLGLAAGAAATAGITLWVGLWWIFEPVPLPATSLIPFAAFPLAGVLPNKVIAQAYGHWLILLLLGGFILSTAMEKSGVHRRIAIGMIRGVGGTSPARLILGVMLATGLLSGWISNTATVLMMLPVAIALCGELPGPKSVRSLMLAWRTPPASVASQRPSAHRPTWSSWEFTRRPRAKVLVFWTGWYSAGLWQPCSWSWLGLCSPAVSKNTQTKTALIGFLVWEP